jgi:hypothetical protein
MVERCRSMCWTHASQRGSLNKNQTKKIKIKTAAVTIIADAS